MLVHRCPTISAVVPAFNGEQTIVRAVESLLDQDWSALEIIVIDDASDDNTWEILQRFGTHIRAIRHPRNAGLSNTLNTGIAAASGRWILRSDQDDWSEPERVGLLWDAVSGHPNTQLASSLVNIVPDSGPVPGWVSGLVAWEQQRQRISGRYKALTSNLLFKGNIFHHGEVLFSKGLWQAVGGYRWQFEMSEDLDLWLRMSGKTNYYVVPKFLYNRRVGAANTSNRNRELQDFTTRLAVQAAQRRAEGSSDDEWSAQELLAAFQSGDVGAQIRQHLACSRNLKIDALEG